MRERGRRGEGGEREGRESDRDCCIERKRKTKILSKI